MTHDHTHFAPVATPTLYHMTPAVLVTTPTLHYMTTPTASHDSHTCISRMEDASAYIEFILNSIQSRDLFHSLQIEPTSCWEYLMWMDQVG